MSVVLDYEISAMTGADGRGVAELLELPGVRFGTFVHPFRTTAFVERAQRRAADGDLTLVARSAGTVIGQAMLTAGRGRRRHAGSVFLAVHDAYRGQGVGSSLLGSIIAFSERRQGLARLELFVFHDNDAALALYEKMGFVREGLHTAYAFRDGVRVACVSMARIREGEPAA